MGRLSSIKAFLSLSTRELRVHALFSGIGFVACVIAYYMYVTDWNGVGYLAHGVVSGVLILVTASAPILLGARPIRVWIVGSLSSQCLLLSLAAYAVGGSIGPFAYTDVIYFTAYVLLCAWLIMLWRQVRAESTRLTMVDALTGLVGALLVVWSGAVAPVLGGVDFARAVIAAVYPTMDMLLLVVVVNMTQRVRVVTPPLVLLVATFGYLLAIDALYSTYRILTPATNPAPFEAAYLFFFLLLASAASHPTISRMARPRFGPSDPLFHRPGPYMVFLTITPVVISTGSRLNGSLDLIVRVVLVTALMSLLFVRLTQTMVDLTKAEGDSRHRATHDGLTGLPNRPALLQHLGKILARNHDQGRLTAVLFLDCDDFKHVNDTWGHEAGDRLLTGVAHGLPEYLRPGDLLARHGGDEFVIAATIDQAEDAQALAQRVLDFFEAPMNVAPGRSHQVTSSVGIALARPGEEISTQDLLSRADVAMYEAKRHERGRCVVFDDELAETSRTRSAIGARLGYAIRSGEFDVLFQPIKGGPDFGKLLGWEALARWKDPELGEVPPEMFVPVAEQLGLVGELGEFVLRRACRDLVVLRKGLGCPDLKVSVNVSPVQLLNPQFADLVRDACTSAGLPTDGLILEVTETLLVDKGPIVPETLSDLRRLGVDVTIDDFGTGYASLSTLLRLPVDCVKLDRSLVARIGVDANARRQLGAVVDLLRSLGIERIVGEGVETAEEACVLTEVGVPMAQGWLYGRPKSTTRILADLSTPAVP